MDKILEFHFTVEKLASTTKYEGVRIEYTPKVTLMDILTDKIQVTPHGVRQLLKRTTT
jgi:hypothetical protein